MEWSAFRTGGNGHRPGELGKAFANGIALNTALVMAKPCTAWHLVRSGRSAEEAEGLLQDALLAIHLKRHPFDLGSLFTPWVHAIARYKLIDHIRRNRISRASVPIDDHQDLMPTYDEASIESTDDFVRLLGTFAGKDPPDDRSREVRRRKRGRDRCALPYVGTEGEDHPPPDW